MCVLSICELLQMQQQVAANPAASNLLSGYQQKPTGYPQGYNNTGQLLHFRMYFLLLYETSDYSGYEESLSQDFSKAPTYGGMNQGQKAGQNNTGGTTGVNYSSGDLKSGYNAGMNKVIVCTDPGCK